MLAFKEWLVTTLTTDSQLQTLLGAASAAAMPIYPTDVDIQPEAFPAITYGDVANIVLTVPRGMHIGVIQLNIWSQTSAFETESIYTRIQHLLNFKDSTTQTLAGTLWWARENAARDMHTPSRRMWQKQMDIKYWTTTVDST
jgi:hypothetical protein